MATAEALVLASISVAHIVALVSILWRDIRLGKWPSCTLNPFVMLWSKYVILERTVSISYFDVASAL